MNRALESFACRASKRIVAISEGLARYLSARGAAPWKVRIIPNWVDAEEIRPLPRENGFRAAHGLSGRFVVLYAGNMGVLGGLDVALGAACLLRGQGHIQFLFVGQGNAAERLRRRGTELKLDNAQFLPLQPRAVLPEMLAASNLALVTLDRRITTTSVPSKTYTIMAAGRAILAAVDPANEVARLVRDVDCGICVRPDAPDEMAAAILAASRQPDSLDAAGRRGRQYILQWHVRGDLTQRYHQLLCEVHPSALGACRPDQHPRSATRTGE
jgi:colanic acid biosynthesis glycosyl transferase WcaI